MYRAQFNSLKMVVKLYLLIMALEAETCRAMSYYKTTNFYILLIANFYIFHYVMYMNILTKFAPEEEYQCLCVTLRLTVGSVCLDMNSCLSQYFLVPVLSARKKRAIPKKGD
jgi:hypothetical protein